MVTNSVKKLGRKPGKPRVYISGFFAEMPEVEKLKRLMRRDGIRSSQFFITAIKDAKE